MPDPSIYQNQQAMHFGTHLHMQGVKHEDLDTMPADQLAAHATRAGLSRVPKGDTLEMTKSYMQKLAKPAPADPFAGL
jgi:hypothetical protein